MKCEICERVFKTDRGLKIHMAHVHPASVPVVKDEPPADEPESPIEGKMQEMSRLDFYKLDAERLADAQEHALDAWHEENLVAIARCRLCGAQVVAAQHPRQGGSNVSGEAVSRKCGAKA